MNKALYIILPVVLLLAIGGYLVFKGNNEKDMTSDGDDSSMMVGGDSQAKNGDFTGSFMDLVKLGKNYTCTFETTDQAGNMSSGTVYVAASGDKMQGDFETKQADGTAMQSHIVRDGSYNYVWTSLSAEGYKMPITETDTSLFGSSSDNKTKTGIVDEDNVNFDCNAWKVDNSKFVPPSSITFVDFSLQMQQVENSMAPTTKVDCSVCDQAPAGTAQDQCRLALGC